MIKGVNKQVLEINETQTDYFERAIFFVKPEYAGLSEGKLREIARRELSDAAAPPLTKIGKRSFNWRRAALFSGVLLLGVLVGIFLGAAL